MLLGDGNHDTSAKKNAHDGLTLPHTAVMPTHLPWGMPLPALRFAPTCGTGYFHHKYKEDHHAGEEVLRSHRFMTHWLPKYIKHLRLSLDGLVYHHGQHKASHSQWQADVDWLMDIPSLHIWLDIMSYMRLVMTCHSHQTSHPSQEIIARLYHITEAMRTPEEEWWAISNLAYLLSYPEQINEYWYNQIFCFLQERPWFQYKAEDLPRSSLNCLAQRNCKGLLSLLRGHSADADSHTWRHVFGMTRTLQSYAVEPGRMGLQGAWVRALLNPMSYIRLSLTCRSLCQAHPPMQLPKVYDITEVRRGSAQDAPDGTTNLQRLQHLLRYMQMVDGDYEAIFIFFQERPWFVCESAQLPRLGLFAQRGRRGLLSLLRCHVSDPDTQRWRRLWRITRRGLPAMSLFSPHCVLLLRGEVPPSVASHRAGTRWFHNTIRMLRASGMSEVKALQHAQTAISSWCQRQGFHPPNHKSAFHFCWRWRQTINQSE